MSNFVTGIHPRLHFWRPAAPAGIRTEDDLRRRVDPPADEYVQWLRDRILMQAGADARREPVIAAGGKGESISACCHAAWYRVKTAGIAHILTGEDRYFLSAKRQVFAMCDEWCPWLDHYHMEFGWQSCLRTGMALWTVALAYDWFYDRFTPGERRHLAEAMRERGFRLWLKDRNSLTNYASNWCACVAGGVGIAAMATIEDIPESLELAELTAQHVPRMLEAFGADGGWPEGAAYWGGTSLLVEYLDILRTATAGKLDYLADERLRRTCWFPLYCTLARDGIANFADGSYNWSAPLPFAAVAAVRRDQHMQWAFRMTLDRYRRGGQASGEIAPFFLFYDPSVPSQAPEADIPRGKAFRDIGWIAIRNGWGDDDPAPAIMAKAGNNRHGGCQHFDVGNVIANAFGERMLCDYGYGNGTPSWTWKERPDENGMCRQNDPLYSTVGHNVVVIGGRHQRLRGMGEVLDFHNDDNLGAVVALDCTGAYDGVVRAMRHVLHLRPDILVVLDTIELAQAEEAWLSCHLPEIGLPDGFPMNGDISPHLTPIEAGRFRRVARAGRTEGLCVSLSDAAPRFLSGAHRRLGMLDRDSRLMPNTIYPYVRCVAAPAVRHVFLSSFAFLPGITPEALRWTQVEGGAFLSLVSRRIAVLTQPGRSIADASSDAWCCVADLQCRRAVACGTGCVEVDGRRVSWSQTNRSVAWEPA